MSLTKSSAAATKLVAVAGVMIFGFRAATSRRAERLAAVGTNDESRPLLIRELTASGTVGLITPAAAAAIGRTASSTADQALSTAPAGSEVARSLAKVMAGEGVVLVGAPPAAFVVLAALSACCCKRTLLLPMSTSLTRPRAPASGSRNITIASATIKGQRMGATACNRAETCVRVLSAAIDEVWLETPTSGTPTCGGRNP